MWSVPPMKSRRKEITYPTFTKISFHWINDHTCFFTWFCWTCFVLMTVIVHWMKHPTLIPEVDQMLFNKVALWPATHSGYKRHESIYQMLNELDSTIWVHHISSPTHGDAFIRSLVGFEILNITNWFCDGWYKEFEILHIEGQFGDGWNK